MRKIEGGSLGPRKIPFDDCICVSPLEGHGKIKDEILELIARSSDSSMVDSENYIDADHHKSNISKLDWDKCRDFSRPWVELFLPKFATSVGPIIKGMAYEGLRIEQMWYQQYLTGSHHAWHIHDYHYTGVYYLEYPKGSAKTEICSPYSLKKQSVEIKEGDFIIFPAHWIHRAPANNSIRKTIISYNFSIVMENPERYYLGIEKLS